MTDPTGSRAQLLPANTTAATITRTTMGGRKGTVVTIMDVPSRYRIVVKSDRTGDHSVTVDLPEEPK